MTRLTLIRLTTCVYILLIVGVIVSATNRWFPDVFRFVLEHTTDKVMHFVLVGILCLLVNLSLSSKCWTFGSLRIQTGTVALIVITTLEEFSQQLFKNRTFDGVDLLCNLAGIIVFGVVAWFASGWLGLRSPANSPSTLTDNKQNQNS